MNTEKLEGRNSNGTFAKGHAGFKPKGSRNRITKENLAIIEARKQNDLEALYELLDSVEDPKLKFEILKFTASYSDDKTFIEEKGDTDMRIDRSALIDLIKGELDV
ncbi:hypothetical protein AB4331_05875 [Vibrio breoganii]